MQTCKVYRFEVVCRNVKYISSEVTKESRPSADGNLLVFFFAQVSLSREQSSRLLKRRIFFPQIFISAPSVASERHTCSKRPVFVKGIQKNVLISS